MKNLEITLLFEFQKKKKIIYVLLLALKKKKASELYLVK